MKNKIFAILLFVLMTGCTEHDKDLTQYRCSDKQMKDVEQQTLFCNENTSYFNHYCYKSAFERNCNKATK